MAQQYHLVPERTALLRAVPREMQDAGPSPSLAFALHPPFNNIPSVLSPIIHLLVFSYEQSCLTTNPWSDSKILIFFFVLWLVF